MFRKPPSSLLISCAGLLALSAGLACSDATGPGSGVAFVSVEAWACPEIPLSELTFERCARDGQPFDPTEAHVPNRISVMVVVVQVENTDHPHRLLARILEGGRDVNARIFPPMSNHDNLQDVLTDTISVPPLPEISVDIVIELATGERIPFLTLLADTTFHWN